ncbi:MAG: hypothetical protein U0989_00395 [Azonexus sp.]|nr:hypothetical protein [Azonexus sp.]MDP3636540.1 hypothetical protein [Azonexus sp.]MDZ4313229.1 hypothetical protein [Azonexus sp.]
MYAYKIETEIPPSHRLSIELPADCPTGLAEIIVLAKENAVQAAAPGTGETMADLVAWLRTQPASNRTPEDFEAQIQAERNAWGD